MFKAPGQTSNLTWAELNVNERSFISDFKIFFHFSKYYISWPMHSCWNNELWVCHQIINVRVLTSEFPRSVPKLLCELEWSADKLENKILIANTKMRVGRQEFVWKLSQLSLLLVKLRWKLMEVSRQEFVWKLSQLSLLLLKLRWQLMEVSRQEFVNPWIPFSDS